jgi:16S rRNA (guanine966-N2)-methyltransferase
MSERIKGAVFNALGDLHGLRVLDAFAGSGALGFEAVSRGASHVTAVESDATAYKTIVRNAKGLRLSEPSYKATWARMRSWQRRQSPGTLFDVILADPPYDDIQEQVVYKLHEMLTPDGLMVVSWPGKWPLPRWPLLEVVQTKNYGDAQLIYFRRLANSVSST